MAFRRSQHRRSSSSTTSSRDSDFSDSDDVINESFDDVINYDLIDYLPPQTSKLQPDTIAMQAAAAMQDKHIHQQATTSQNFESVGGEQFFENADQSVSKQSTRSDSREDVYIRLASQDSQQYFPSTQNKKSKNRHKKIARKSTNARGLLSKANFPSNSSAYAQPRPLYNQANFGPLNPRIPRPYQSFPNYPRYRQPRRPPPQPNWNLYFILAFLLLGLMIISFMPLIF